MLSSASFGSLLASVGLAIGLVGALLCVLARRAGPPKVIFSLDTLPGMILKDYLKDTKNCCISGGSDAILAGKNHILGCSSRSSLRCYWSLALKRIAQPFDGVSHNSLKLKTTIYVSRLRIDRQRHLSPYISLLHSSCRIFSWKLLCVKWLLKYLWIFFLQNVLKFV